MKIAHLALTVALCLAPLALAQQQAPPPPSPEVLRAAEEAIRQGRGFQLIPPQIITHDATATGATSHGVGDGVKFTQSGTAPALAMPGGLTASGGDNKSSGGANAFTPFDSSEASLAGFACIALGVLSLVACGFFPKWPASPGWILIGIGLVLLIAPRWLNEHPALAVLGAGLIGVPVAIYLGYKNKWFDAAVGPTVQQELLSKGQTVAAGALATVEMSKPFAAARTVARAARTRANAKVAINKAKLEQDPDAPK